MVLEAGASITLMAGGQHLVIGAGGIFSSTPIVLGGAPVPGTPASPLVPEGAQSLFTPFQPYSLLRQRKNLLKEHALCAICEEQPSTPELSS